MAKRDITQPKLNGELSVLAQDWHLKIPMKASETGKRGRLSGWSGRHAGSNLCSCRRFLRDWMEEFN